MSKSFFLALVILFPVISYSQYSGSLADSLQNYFAEISAAARQKQSLWHIDLYGPLLIVNPETRQAYANFPDSAGILLKEKNMYTGKIPVDVNLANTSMKWNGTRWAMVLLPLPADKQDRINLLAHELFHKAQPALGLEQLNSANTQLDQAKGRIYLRLELAALQNALESSTTAQAKMHIANALSFRNMRYRIYPGADTSENRLELNEGLAEYTGLMISNRTPAATVVHFKQKLAAFLSDPSFVRSFAYHTIPAYGYLLQTVKKQWNLDIHANTNLTNYFIDAFHIKIKDDSASITDSIAVLYEGQAIIASETEREANFKKLLAVYKATLVDSPHLEIHFEQMNVSFDPRNVLALENLGMVYPTIRISDNWGILTVTGGALMSPGWDKIAVGIPATFENDNVSGNGWQLSLKPGYTVTKDNQTGNYTLMKK